MAAKKRKTKIITITEVLEAIAAVTGGEAPVFEEDNDGQIVIYLDRKLGKNDELLPFPPLKT